MGEPMKKPSIGSTSGYRHFWLPVSLSRQKARCPTATNTESPASNGEPVTRAEVGCTHRHESGAGPSKSARAIVPSIARAAAKNRGLNMLGKFLQRDPIIAAYGHFSDARLILSSSGTGALFSDAYFGRNVTP